MTTYDNTSGERPSVKVAQAMYPRAAEIVGSGVEHVPMMCVEMHSGQREVMPMVGLEKDDIALMQRTIAAHPKVKVVALVMEAWILKANANDPNDEKITKAVLDGQLTVSEVPGRQECVLFNLRVGDEQFLASCDIVRAGEQPSLVKGTLIDLVAEQRKGTGHHEGRFIGSGNRAEQRARREAN
jgi:hypothetical protein